MVDLWYPFLLFREKRKRFTYREKQLTIKRTKNLNNYRITCANSWPSYQQLPNLFFARTWKILQDVLHKQAFCKNLVRNYWVRISCNKNAYLVKNCKTKNAFACTLTLPHFVRNKFWVVSEELSLFCALFVASPSSVSRVGVLAIFIDNYWQTRDCIDNYR